MKFILLIAFVYFGCFNCYSQLDNIGQSKSEVIISMSDYTLHSSTPSYMEWTITSDIHYGFMFINDTCVSYFFKTTSIDKYKDMAASLKAQGEFVRTDEKGNDIFMVGWYYVHFSIYSSLYDIEFSKQNYW